MKLYEEDIIADSLSDEILGILGSMGSDDEKIAAILAAADKVFNRNSDSPSNADDSNSGPESGDSEDGDDGKEKNTVYRDGDDDLGQGVEGEKRGSKQTSIQMGDDDIDLNKGNGSEKDAGDNGDNGDNGDKGEHEPKPGATHDTKGTGHDVGNPDKADATPQPGEMGGEQGTQSQQTDQDQGVQPQNSPQSGMQQNAPRRSTQGQDMDGGMPFSDGDDFGETGDSAGQSNSRSTPRNNNGQSNSTDDDIDYDPDDNDGGPEGDNVYGHGRSSRNPMNNGQSSDGGDDDGGDDDEWDNDFGGGQGQGDSRAGDGNDNWDDEDSDGGQGQSSSQGGDEEDNWDEDDGDGQSQSQGGGNNNDEQDDSEDGPDGQNGSNMNDQNDGMDQSQNQGNDSDNQGDKSNKDSSDTETDTQDKSQSQNNKKDSSTNPQQGQGSDSNDTQDQGQGQGQNKDQTDQQEQPENPDNFDNDIVSDYDKGSNFGEFLAGLIYTFGGNPAAVMGKMHFDKVYELPDLPTMKVKNIHDIDFSGGTPEEPVGEALHESEEEIDIINDLRSALQGANNKKKLAKIMAILARRKNGKVEPENGEPGQEPGGEPGGTTPAAPEPQKKGDVDWTKVKIAVADGDCDGTGKLFGDNHVMTDDLKQELEDARAAKLKKTTFDKESPFSSEDGLLKTIEQVTGRMFGKDFQPDSEDPAAKNLQRIKERLRYNRKGFVNWINLLIKYLKGIKFNREKTVFTTRTIVDPDSPARYYYDPVSEIGNKIVVYLDVSGSVLGTPGVLSQVIAELKKIAKDCKFRKMDIVCFAGNILDNYCLYNQTPSELKDPNWSINVPPGGSTVYSAVYNHMFKYYYKTAKKVSAMLIFSDSDALASSNIFTNWGKKEANKKKAAFISQKFGNKCVFIGINENASQLPEYKAATIPGTKVILVSGRDFTTALEGSLNNFEVQEELNNNNHNMFKNYFKVDNNLNEMAFTRRKNTPQDPAATPGAEQPAAAAPVPPEDPEDSKEPMDMNTLLDRAEKKAVRRANREGSSRYEGSIDEWMSAVFGMWHIKKVAGTQAMIAEPQTYCVILDNDIFKVAINNELSSGQGGKKAVGAAYAAQRITIPPKALTPNFMEMGENIQIISLRGNIKVANFTGEKLPPFFPKRLIANMNGQGGNFYISNCPNLSSTENWPVSLDGKVIIEGRINISEDELDAYDEKVQAFEAQRRADIGLPPIANPDSKVEY